MISCFPDMYSGLLVPSDQSAATRFFRVLGDPTRLHILQLLEERELTMSELVATVGQPQPRVSTHLACLRHCGFVRPIGAAKRSSAAWRCAASTEPPRRPNLLSSRLRSVWRPALGSDPPGYELARR